MSEPGSRLGETQPPPQDNSLAETAAGNVQATLSGDALVGTTLSGRYQIVRLLGEGAMGAVYEARHTLIKKSVALKVLHPEMMAEHEIVERFKREAQAAAHIEHPNVCAATDFGETKDGAFFMVMEMLDGLPLDELISEQTRVKPERALRIARQITSALVRSHELGIIHRDLKPANIMLVERDGEPDFVKVLDFGVARVRLEDDEPDDDSQVQLTQAGLVYGTLTYMPPEQASGIEIDDRSDLYAVGVILYELLTGRPPFVGNSPMRIAAMHMTQEPPTFSEVAEGVLISPDVEALVRRLLEKAPDDRFSSASELYDAISELLPSDEPTSEIITLPAPPSDPVQTRTIWLVLGLGAVIMLLIAVVLVLVLTGEDEDSDDDSASSSSSSSSSPFSGPSLDDDDPLDDDGSLPALPSELEPIQKQLEDDPKGALAALDELSSDEQAQPWAQVLRGHALMAREKYKDGVAAYEAAIEQIPAFASHPRVLDHIFDCFYESSSSTAKPAITFVKEHRSRPVRARLADFAATSNRKRVRNRARIVLEEDYGGLERSEEIGIELRRADNCEERKPLVLELGEINNPDVLPVLEYWSGKDDCGFNEDCMECVRDELEAIMEGMR